MRSFFEKFIYKLAFLKKKAFISITNRRGQEQLYLAGTFQRRGIMLIEEAF